jgi:tetratricopeptide (TPR) repeat protein
LWSISLLFLASHAAAEPISSDESMPPLESSPEKSNDAADAINLFRMRDYDGAFKRWQEIVKSRDDMPPAALIMARMYLQAGMVKEAVASLDKAVAEAPNDPEIYYVLATIAIAQKDLDKADAMLQKATGLMSSLEKLPGRKQLVQREIELGMAQLAEVRKDWPKARGYLEKDLTKNPNVAETRNRLAFCLFQMKDTDGAYRILREGFKAGSQAVPPEIMMAQFFDQANDTSSANHWLSIALNAEPKNIFTLLTASRKALDNNDLIKAQKYSIAATRADPKSNDAKSLRGLIALYQHDFATAESIYDAILKTAPNVAISNNLALALIEQGDDAKKKLALKIAEANAKDYPKWPEIASTYAIVLYRLGRLDDAEKAAQPAESIADRDGDTAYALACIASDRGDKEKAKKLLETVLAKKPAFMYRPDAEELLEKLTK